MIAQLGVVVLTTVMGAFGWSVAASVLIIKAATRRARREQVAGDAARDARFKALQADPPVEVLTTGAGYVSPLQRAVEASARRRLWSGRNPAAEVEVVDRRHAGVVHRFPLTSSTEPVHVALEDCPCNPTVIGSVSGDATVVHWPWPDHVTAAGGAHPSP